MELPKWKSHKVVEAAEILDIQPSTSGLESALTLAGLPHQPSGVVIVTTAYIEKHDPQVGGYYVRYPDGYESWSPREAFEEGYTLHQESEDRPEEAPVRETSIDQTPYPGPRFPLAKMAIGDSLFIRVADDSPAAHRALMADVIVATRLDPSRKRFEARQVTEGGVKGVRVWRLPTPPQTEDGTLTEMEGRPKQRPSIGRAVHFNDDPYPSQDAPGQTDDNWIHATIIWVHPDDTVNLECVDKHGSRSFQDSVTEGTGRYNWRWPPRV